MNHPNREEWVPYLYGEAEPATERRLTKHFHACAECRAEFTRWKQSAHRLGAWKLPRIHQPSALWPAILKWTAATAMILALGFGLGRLSTSRPNYEQLRAQIEPRLRQELSQMLREQIGESAVTTLEVAGQQSQKLLAAYAVLNEQRRAEENHLIRADILSLKDQLDTVAVNTDSSFRRLVASTRPSTGEQN